MFIDINPENTNLLVLDTFNLRDENPVSKNVKTRKISNPNLSMREIHQRIIQAVKDLDNWFWGSFDSPFGNANNTQTIGIFIRPI